MKSSQTGRDDIVARANGGPFLDYDKNCLSRCKWYPGTPKKCQKLIDPEREPDRAKRAWESHLSRATWLMENGFRHLLRGGATH
jgi:hypothetical protein